MLVVLKDGTRLAIRPIRPTDKAGLVEALGQLSQASVRSRFLGGKDHFTAHELAYLTEVDGIDHVALVATPPDDPARLVAVGRFVRDAALRDTAEVAVTVCDALQGRGLGKILARELGDAARTLGIRRFTATMLADNVAAHRLFASASERLEDRIHDGIRELSVPLAA
jgi:protein lysine acetyltransferase